MKLFITGIDTVDGWIACKGQGGISGYDMHRGLGGGCGDKLIGFPGTDLCRDKGDYYCQCVVFWSLLFR